MKNIVSYIVCLCMCVAFTIPVSAKEKVQENETEMLFDDVSLTNYFTKTIKLNSVNGNSSGIVTISSGSITGNPETTSIILNIRANAGSDPFILYIQAPDGTVYSILVTGSKTIELSFFNGCNPSGSWKIWIETQGTASTANITMKVNYSY